MFSSPDLVNVWEKATMKMESSAMLQTCLVDGFNNIDTTSTNGAMTMRSTFLFPLLLIACGDAETTKTVLLRHPQKARRRINTDQRQLPRCQWNGSAWGCSVFLWHMVRNGRTISGLNRPISSPMRPGKT